MLVRTSRVSSLAARSGALGIFGGAGELGAVWWSCGFGLGSSGESWDDGTTCLTVSCGAASALVSYPGLTGGVCPRRKKFPMKLGLGAVAELGDTTRRVLFSGTFKGATSGSSFTGSTRVVRPLAPRHPGRLDANAPAAGSSCESLGPAIFAIFRTRSPNVTGAGAVLWGGDDACPDTPKPWTNSAGLTCDGRPWGLVVRSPVSGSHRGPSCGASWEFWGC